MQSDNAIKALYLDILSIHKMHLYKDVCAKPDVVKAVLKSFYKHSWYLNLQLYLFLYWIKMFLMNKKVRLPCFNMPNSDCFKINNKSPIEVENKIRIEKRVYNDPPSLSLLVDQFSYLMFEVR